MASSIGCVWFLASTHPHRNVGADLGVFHRKRSDGRGKGEAEQPSLNAAAERRAVLWSAAAFLAIAVVGLLFAPGLHLWWAVLLFFGVAAVPPALRRNR
jgi:hypothetical protein